MRATYARWLLPFTFVFLVELTVIGMFGMMPGLWMIPLGSLYSFVFVVLEHWFRYQDARLRLHTLTSAWSEIELMEVNDEERLLFLRIVHAVRCTNKKEPSARERLQDFLDETGLCPGLLELGFIWKLRALLATDVL